VSSRFQGNLGKVSCLTAKWKVPPEIGNLHQVRLSSLEEGKKKERKKANKKETFKKLLKSLLSALYKSITNNLIRRFLL